MDPLTWLGWRDRARSKEHIRQGTIQIPFKFNVKAGKIGTLMYPENFTLA
jgi:hypothetical protein